MPLQVGAPGKTFPTVNTLVWFVSNVALAMSLQRSRIAEALPTLGTAVGLLTSWGMDPLVSEQRGADTEALPAVGTLIGTLPSVGSLVNS